MDVIVNKSRIHGRGISTLKRFKRIDFLRIMEI